MLVLPIFAISFILQLFLPWWMIGVVAFAMGGWQARTPKHAFKGAFTAIFLLWLVVSLWKSIPNEHRLANRIGEMFMLPHWSYNWIIMILVSALLGGLAAGVAALSGHLTFRAFSDKRVKKH